MGSESGSSSLSWLTRNISYRWGGVRLESFGCGCQNRFGIPFWGRCTHFRTYVSGDWDVRWGYDLDFDPWPFRPWTEKDQVGVSHLGDPLLSGETTPSIGGFTKIHSHQLAIVLSLCHQLVPDLVQVAKS